MTDPRVAELGRREALLARMRNVARDDTGDEPVRRVHLTVAMDRFLVRLLATTSWGTWVLKGGYANQLCHPGEARFTEDVDLRTASRRRMLTTHNPVRGHRVAGAPDGGAIRPGRRVSRPSDTSLTPRPRGTTLAGRVRRTAARRTGGSGHHDYGHGSPQLTPPVASPWSGWFVPSG